MTNPTARIIGAKLAEAEQRVNHSGMIGFEHLLTVSLDWAKPNSGKWLSSVRVNHLSILACA